MDLLQRRMDELDQGLSTGPYSAGWLLEHFVTVMRFYTNTSMSRTGPGVFDPAVIHAVDSDEIVARSPTVSALAMSEQPLATGPISRDHQHWIGTKKQVLVDGTITPPSESNFIRPDQAIGQKPRSMPFELGLFTSTAASTGVSMWRMYLDMFPTSILHPRPWHTWKVNLAADGIPVLEIRTAVEWVDFVASYGRMHDDIIHPDWPAAARDFAGVHITLSAIAAAQGFSFPTRRGLTGPAFWDVEQTLWLRWPIQSAHLVNVVE